MTKFQTSFLNAFLLLENFFLKMSDSAVEAAPGVAGVLKP